MSPQEKPSDTVEIKGPPAEGETAPRVLRVTRKAFQVIYRDQGFTVVDRKSKKEAE